MKDNNKEFYSRVVKVTTNIIGYYYVCPTFHRYDRLIKILERLTEINDTLDDNNRYRHDNWNMLITVKSVLQKLMIITHDAQTEHVDAPRHRDRKVIVELGTCYLSLNDKR